MTETETKSVSKSVSMPESLWKNVEDHAPTTPGKDRSGYIRNLVESDLKAAGRLGSDTAQELEAIREAKAKGVDVVATLVRAARRAGKEAVSK